ncbi:MULTISPECIES: aminotransferase class V-fold PLP-dependent enzyme [unclassified Marinitoga]|uniref:aminotransferase class V-fold PLP-dependent enzyme n=1 Tax=unclassified Marinitoga TaxID=2640159 RepID=UPI000657FB62|nr:MULTISPECIES: SufS family cysteine desulfurase [unclassified Marinitoga]KLO21385.1 cysteine desulfurase [Marinitoga sp. 1155]
MMLYKKDLIESFPILKRKINSKNLVYFDNAATTLTPVRVTDTIKEFYDYHNANVHRGAHLLSNEATEMYENSRKTVAKFINAKTHEIIFTRGTTESINLFAYSIGKSGWLDNKEILITTIEHHSNFVPWQQLSKTFGFFVRYYNPEKGIFVLEEFLKHVNENTKLISITGLSNVTGQIIPIKEIIEFAHKRDILVHVDGAQLVPHLGVDVSELDVDFLSFSGHKMLGPMGIGIFYGKKRLLKKLPPFHYGGEMINWVSMEETDFAELPEKFQAGTPNVGGAVGLKAAIDYINEIGIDTIKMHSEKLTKYAVEKLKELNFVKLYGPENRISIISFNIDNVHPHDVAQILSDKFGVAVRSGHLCAQPLLKQFGTKSVCRASFYFYNSEEEVDIFIDGLKYIKEWFS